MKKYAFLICLFLLACDFFNTEFEDSEDAVLYEAGSKTAATQGPAALKVMNWNVKFGGARIDFFFDCHGDRVLMSESEVIENTDNIIDRINLENPDILIVQEIDTNSKRTAYVDQVEQILNNTQFNYAAYASQWKADYIPSDGIGRVNSGNAVFSRWPFLSAERIQLPLRTDQSSLDLYFYLKRNILKTKIDLGAGKNVYVVASHTSAYSTDGTKKNQIDIFKDELDKINNLSENLIAAADLNTIPPGSAKLSDFPDSVCTEEFLADDYTDEVKWLDDLYAAYTPAISLTDYGTTELQNQSYYTHTTDKNGFWNRKLDYIFTNMTLSGPGSVLQDTMSLSDHAPVMVTITVP
ncbi:MAG: endonuclease/exonuclease/phosphatase family protein [Spirochaetia bacterium]|nr:endonuclease/exonuclease/phosphatase family protein [Spirochaetia bacterium]